jgi:hypothetical protein
MKFRSLLCIFFALTVCSLLNAQALDGFIVEYNGGSYSCSDSGDTYEVGEVLENGRIGLISKKIRQLRASIEKAEGAKKIILSKKLKSLNKLKRNVIEVCRGVGGNPPPSGTSTPAPTPTSATGGGSSFDAQGNVTQAGMALFSIPSGLSANIERGRVAHEQNCGCHLVKPNLPQTGRPFTNLRARIAQSPMFLSESKVSDATLADITAYLNRFR